MKSVSVVIPTYNRASLLPRAISSVQNQIRKPAEIIVVDDGSTDDTAEVVGRIATVDSTVRFVQQANRGAPAARNHGVRLATGDLVAFQDSDDEWDLRFLASVAPAVDGPNTIAFSSHRVVHRDGATVDVPPALVADTARGMRRGNLASTQTVVLERSLAVAYPFDERLRRFQDWDLWLTMLSAGVRFVHIPESLATLYREQDSISEGSRAVRAESLRTISRKHRHLLRHDPYAVARLWVRAYLRGPAPTHGQGRSG